MDFFRWANVVLIAYVVTLYWATPPRPEEWRAWVTFRVVLTVVYWLIVEGGAYLVRHVRWTA